MNNKVYKFGGASVKDADGFANVVNILNLSQGDKILTVVSATGKTTNALEEVVNAYVRNDGKAEHILEKIKEDHNEILGKLAINDESCLSDVSDTFVEIDWILEEEVQDEYNYIYDQIVSVGELVSSKILYYYCKSKGVKVAWLDVRDVLLTDNTYREAKVQWEETQRRIKEQVGKLFLTHDVVITQGFIGSSTENFNTTLGREGSDFSAAVFSYCLDADNMTIWKDVPGILTGDPRIFDNVTKIDRLDYTEAIEMTYFGAKVIHPKTIKPLQNKNIPLHVRPFDNPSSEGTIITSNVDTVYPPVIVIEMDQVLIHISTKDFSFVAEEHLSDIFEKLNKHRIKVNMMRNSAISFSVSVQNDAKKIEAFMTELESQYNLLKDDGLELITIRHYDKLTADRLKMGKMVLFEESIKKTLRMVVKDIPPMTRKN